MAEDFDRLTDDQIADNGRTMAQALLAKRLEDRAKWASLGEQFGMLEDFDTGYLAMLVKHVDFLWDLYVEGSCVCHMDHGSRCNCEANSRAAEALQEIIGNDWHDLLRQAKQPEPTVDRLKRGSKR